MLSIAMRFQISCRVATKTGFPMLALYLVGYCFQLMMLSGLLFSVNGAAEILKLLHASGLGPKAN